MKYYYTFIFSALLFLNPLYNFGGENRKAAKCEAFQTGFYAGISGGVSNFRSNSELHSREIVPQGELSNGLSTESYTQILEEEGLEKLTALETSNYHSKLRKTRGSFDLHMGYLYHLPYENCPFVFSPEILFTYHPLSIHTKLKDEPFRYTTKTTYSFGGNLRMGIVTVHNLFLYGFTGITCSPFKFKVHDDTEHRQCAKKTKFKPGFTYGVGIEHELVNAHRVRLELGISCYSKIEFHTTSHDDFWSHALRIKPRIYTTSVMYSVPF